MKITRRQIKSVKLVLSEIAARIRQHHFRRVLSCLVLLTPIHNNLTFQLDVIIIIVMIPRVTDSQTNRLIIVLW